MPENQTSADEDMSFDDFVLDELRILVAEIEEGQKPSNPALYEKVCAEIRRDIQAGAKS